MLRFVPLDYHKDRRFQWSRETFGKARKSFQDSVLLRLEKETPPCTDRAGGRGSSSLGPNCKDGECDRDEQDRVQDPPVYTRRVSRIRRKE